MAMAGVRVLFLLAVIAAAVAAKTSTSDPDDLAKVEKLNFQNFDKIVTASLMPWIVHLRPGGKSKEAKEFAESLEGLARVGTIDTKSETDLLKFINFEAKEESVWRAYIYGKTGEDKKFSDHKTADEAKAAILKSIPKDLVMEITSESATQAFLQGALQKGLVPAIMFTSKKGVPELVLKVAMWVTDMYELAVYPEPDEKTKKGFMIERVPTVEIVLPVIDEKSGKVSFSPIDYKRERFGGLKFQSIISFLAAAKMELTQANKWPNLKPQKEQAEQQQKRQPPPTVDVPPEPIIEVTAETKDACGDGKLGLCVLLLLDGSPMNQAAKEEQIKLLEKVQYSPAQKGRPLHFMWVDAMCHKSFAAALDVPPENLPAIVAFAPKKKKHAHMIGAFSQTSVSAFISQVLGGQVPLIDYKEFPTVDKSDDCEKYYKEQTAVVEEEFDLSEIIGKTEDKVEERKIDPDALRSAEAAAAAIEAAEKEEQMRIVREELERLNKKKKKSKSKKAKTEL